MKGCAQIIGFGVIGIVALIIVVAVAAPKGSSSNTTLQSASAPAGAATSASSSSTRAPAATTAASAVVGQIGNTLAAGNWSITLDKASTASVLGQTQYSKGSKAQGIFVVLQLSAKNLHTQTSTLNTWDFAMRSPTGAKFDTSSDGQTALLITSNSSTSDLKPLTLSEQIQPGLTKGFLLVFDVDPSVKQYTLTAAGLHSAVNL